MACTHCNSCPQYLQTQVQNLQQDLERLKMDSTFKNKQETENINSFKYNHRIFIFLVSLLLSNKRLSKNLIKINNE